MPFLLYNLMVAYYWEFCEAREKMLMKHLILFTIWGGCNGEMEFHSTDENECSGTFFTSRSKLTNYFFNSHYHKFHSQKHARNHSIMRMSELFNPENKNFETFIPNLGRAKEFDTNIGEGLSIGTVKSENPDNSEAQLTTISEVAKEEKKNVEVLVGAY